MGNRFTALVLDDGDLGQVRDVLEELDARVVFRRDRTIRASRVSDFDLLVSSGMRALAWQSPLEQLPASARPIWFAFHHQDFLPLRERLRRQGVDYLIHSNIEREVFRLLLQGVVFGGTGKRRVPRVPVGAPVTWQGRSGPFPATLAELGPLGCRLLSGSEPFRGERVRVALPAALCEGNPVELEGKVLRSCSGPRGSGRTVFAVEFEGLAERAIRIFSNLQAGRAIGARISSLTGASLQRRHPGERATSRELAVPRELEELPKERRVLPRASLRGHNVALLGTRAHASEGQNLSLRALRVTQIAGVAEGERLQVALPRPQSGAPLVLPARAAREDGGNGLLLRFEAVPHALLHELERLIAALPPELSSAERDPSRDPEAFDR